MTLLEKASIGKIQTFAVQPHTHSRVIKIKIFFTYQSVNKHWLVALTAIEMNEGYIWGL